MRKFVSHISIAIITYALCVTATYQPWFNPYVAAPFVVMAALTVWFVGSYVALRQYRYRTDTAALNDGWCPSCRSSALIEVTSGRDPAGQRRVICRDCSNGYAIIAEGDDFVTERLGKTRAS